MTDDEDMQPSVTSRDMTARPSSDIQPIRHGFMRWLVERTRRVHPAYLDGSDPCVEYYDDRPRITDLCGGELKLRQYPPRVLRQLATQLELVADEMERRGFER